MTEPDWNEPEVVINGQPLSMAEAMTLRVAMATFGIHLEELRTKDPVLAHNYGHHLNRIVEKMALNNEVGDVKA